jgi:hypothetical protein
LLKQPRGFFMEGDNILVAIEGQLIQQRYLVVQLTPKTAKLEDTQLKLGQTLQLVPEAAEPAPGMGRFLVATPAVLANAVFEAAQYVDASDPSYTFITYKAGEVRNMPVLRAGNVASPGEIVPRGFPAVLAKGADTTFKQGSGRLELADRIFTDAPALAARVMVNRVWAWHFGKPLVATVFDFGRKGAAPTHPAPLDFGQYLADFITFVCDLRNNGKPQARDTSLSLELGEGAHGRELGPGIVGGQVLAEDLGQSHPPQERVDQRQRSDFVGPQLPTIGCRPLAKLYRL